MPGAYDSDICLVNWPMIDYFEGPVIDVPDAAQRTSPARAELSPSVLYWLQTEAPRPDGGAGFPACGCAATSPARADGLAQAPYIRESPAHPGRVHASSSRTCRSPCAATRARSTTRDSVGVGMYRIDLHPSTGGDNYIDVGSCPFEIPLGALMPRRMENLLPAGKNIGTTHITNGCYRLHPVEWNVGEVAGRARRATAWTTAPRRTASATTPHLLADFQAQLTRDGVELRWPDVSGY